MRRSLALAVVVLGLPSGACEVSTAPAPYTSQPAPARVHAPDPSAPQTASTAEPVPRTEPAAPPEPPWSTAGGLAYREVVLGGAQPDDPLPMIVAIHGLGDAPDNFRHLLDAFEEPARVILPRGLDPVPEGGYSWFPIRARDPDVEGLCHGIEAAAARIAAGVEALTQTRPTVGLPIVTGFSQGGMLTFALAVHHPEVVGEAIAIGGWLPPPLVPDDRPAKGTRFPEIHALHGTDDVAVRLEPTTAGVEALRALGLSVELTTYDGVGHAIPEPMRRDLYDRLTDAVQHERRRRPAP